MDELHTRGRDAEKQTYGTRVKNERLKSHFLPNFDVSLR